MKVGGRGRYSLYSGLKTRTANDPSGGRSFCKSEVVVAARRRSRDERPHTASGHVEPQCSSCSVMQEVHSDDNSRVSSPLRTTYAENSAETMVPRTFRSPFETNDSKDALPVLIRWRCARQERSRRTFSPAALGSLNPVRCWLRRPEVSSNMTKE